jgi:hypothetical protein
MSCTGRSSSATMLGRRAAAACAPDCLFLATHFGGLFVCALMQRAEDRSPYESDGMPRTRCGPRADLGEVLRGLAARGRYGYQGRLGSSLWRQRRPAATPNG